MTDLADLVPQLKRQLAVPGTFATVYPGVTDPDLVGSLADGVGEAQLIGFLSTTVLDTSTNVTTPDLSPAASALVVLFAAERILTMRLLELNQRTALKAGPVEYEVEKAASTLTEILKGLQARRQEIIEAATGVGRTGGGFAMTDMYAVREIGDYSFYAHELL